MKLSDKLLAISSITADKEFLKLHIMRWRQINDETKKIYKKIDGIGERWKYEV